MERLPTVSDLTVTRIDWNRNDPVELVGVIKLSMTTTGFANALTTQLQTLAGIYRVSTIEDEDTHTIRLHVQPDEDVLDNTASLNRLYVVIDETVFSVLDQFDITAATTGT